MKVKKRDGRLEEVNLNKITKRITALSKGLSKVEPLKIAQRVISGLYDGVETSELDRLAVRTAANLITHHNEYDTLAARLNISVLHKETSSSFSETMEKLANRKDDNGNIRPNLLPKFMEVVRKHKKAINAEIVYKRDYNFSFIGIETLKKSYLSKIRGRIVERPQHMWMRVALGIHLDDIEAAFDTYDKMSKMMFTHATPTLFNAGTNRQQMSSCYLLEIDDDSIDGIYKTLSDCAKISQSAGGIGLHIHKIRASGSPIYGTGGVSNGLVPMAKVFDSTANYVDQCFDPDTVIYTVDGIKKIKDVVIGDQVINSDGNTEAVERVFRRNNMGERTAYSLKFKHSITPVTVTGAHPLLSIRNQKKGTNYDVIRNRLDNGLITPEYVSVEELTRDDMVAFPIPTYEKDLSSYSLDDCRFYGAMLGDGYIAKNGRSAYICGNTNVDDFSFYRNYLMSCGLQFNEHKRDENYTRLIFSPHSETSSFKFDRVHLYDQNGEKRVHKSMLHLSKDKISQIIKGLLETDGHIGKDVEGTEIVFEITSHNLAESLRYMMLRLGYLTSGDVCGRVGESHETKNGTIENKKPSYRLRIPKGKEVCDLLGLDNQAVFLTQFRHGNTIYTRLQDITKINYYQGLIYDLKLEGPKHDYLTHCGIAHNGGGRRKGSIAMYLEPWHADVYSFLDLKKNTGKEEVRARSLFYALWVPDLFMERVKNNQDWTLMDPQTCPGLSDCYGEDFKTLYEKYESEGKGETVVKAQDLWKKILEIQIETSMPYILYKDSCNKKSNQKNLGTIKSSNLCAEVVQYTDRDETSVCNLASISLPSFVEGKTRPRFNHQKLHDTVKVVINNLDKIIDLNYYPTKETQTSNFRHRPVGLGVQGLADVFMKMRFPWDTDKAAKLNREIFETMYHAAVEASWELSKSKGKYSSFDGSPMSKGLFQFDLWFDSASDFQKEKFGGAQSGVEFYCSKRYDWEKLRENVVKDGVRNSLLLALMPTASTANILGNTEGFEPIDNNIYKKNTLSGEYAIVNKYLIEDLEAIGLWNDEMRQLIIANDGSIQNISVIPKDIRELYKTFKEIKQRVVIDLAADRGAFICQSQSMNIRMADADYSKLTSMHFYGHKMGLKTGSYYIRQDSKRTAQKFTVDVSYENKAAEMKKAKNYLMENGVSLDKIDNMTEDEVINKSAEMCSLENPESCDMCSG